MYHIVDTGYVCGDCPPGFSGDGETCDSDIKCIDEPCFPGKYFQKIVVFRGKYNVMFIYVRALDWLRP